MIEIERKFLVNNNDFLNHYKNKTNISQGYLNSDSNRTVRIRIKDDKGYITIKGKSNSSGLSRFEWEKEINFEEAKELLKLCEPSIIEKTRYEIEFNNYLFEVDIFEGENKGLIIAEIELKEESELFEKPNWLGEEVTGNTKYYNSYISKNPFKNWQINL